MHLSSQQYGKQRVRVLRVVREEGGLQHVYEVEVSVLLEGDFAESFLTDSNATVVPTDTMKNTVHVLAQDHLGASPELFGLALGDHFLARYAHVEKVHVEVVSRPWDRFINTEGQAHPHFFLASRPGNPFTQITSTRSSVSVKSGVRDLLVLKSTGSAFVGFPRCEYTTLAETDDRILSTSMRAIWTFASRDADFAAENKAAVTALLEVLAHEFSPSVQNTLFLMAKAALAAAPALTEITLKMPNKHYLPINFKPFHRENNNEIFLPTDEPHGQIEATITRDLPPAQP